MSGAITATASVLVVDDDPGVRSFLQDMLTDEGHRVIAVESGEAALAQIAVQEFDLAVIDLKMEGIGGMEVLAELRRRAPDTVAIILTGHASLSTAVEALRQGAHDYLFKPCKLEELRKSVRRGLNRRRDPNGVSGG
ncbi:MAG: response regulator [Anaerolineae bacterium]